MRKHGFKTYAGSVAQDLPAKPCSLILQLHCPQFHTQVSLTNQRTVLLLDQIATLLTYIRTPLFT